VKIVLIYSGGLDSTTLLYHLLSEGHTVKCLSIDYGQRHKKELEAAKRICKDIGIVHQVADLRGITHLIKGSSQSDLSVPVPEGYYASENMKLTVVPNRNMIMLSVAIGWAVSSKFDAVAYGAHAGDHEIYPDCRPEFASAMDTAALLCDWRKIKLIRPFIDETKEDIVQIGIGLDVPFEKTWTCYKGEKLPCGVCGSCQERRAAFKAAEAEDPVKYKSYKIYKKP
jgi:7-cyano-7-deazaguanine synthase